MSASVSLWPDQIELDPGEVGQFTVDVQNQLDTAADYMLDVRGIDSSWLTLRPPMITVGANSTASATVHISLPSEVDAGSRRVTVRVTDRLTRSEIASATATLSIKGEAWPDEDEDATTTKTAQTAEYDNSNRSFIIAGVLALVAIAAIAGIVMALRDSDEPTVEAQDDATVTELPATEIAGEGPISCDTASADFVSLITDDATTAILHGDPSLDSLRILRTEPAQRLSGLYESLLALSPDGQRLAYIMADNPAMDFTTISYIDLDRPGEPQEITALDEGFWPIQPAWSPDNLRLAFVRVDPNNIAVDALQLEIWIVDESGGQQSVGAVSVSDDTLASIDHTAPLCWSEDGQTIVFNLLNSQVEFDIATLDRRTVEREMLAGGQRPPEPGGTGCGVPVFSQNDPAWRHLVMQTWGDTIGDFGCALTSAAMVLNYYGAPVNPATLNDCLGPYAELLHWDQVPACSSGMASFLDRADFTWNRLDQVLASGRPAIVGMVRGQTGMHFVVVTSGGGGNAANYSVTDPWDGSTSKSLQSLFNSGYNPAWVVEYSGSNAGSCERVVEVPASPIAEGVDGSIHKDSVDVGKMVEEDDESVTVVVQVWPPVLTTGDDPSPIATVTPEDIDGIVLPPASDHVIDVEDLILDVVPVTPDLMLDDEGIYYLFSISDAPDAESPTVSRAKFTMDRTPPETGVSAIGELLGGSNSQTGSTPQFIDEAHVQLLAHDSLSGVISVEYRLSGGEWEPYSDDVSFRRTLTFDEPGNYELEYKATDLAGNESEIESFRFSIVTDEQPEPTATPALHPTPTPPEAHPTPAPTPEPTASPTPVPMPSLEAEPDELHYGEIVIGSNGGHLRVAIQNVSEHPVEIHNIWIEAEITDEFILTNADDCLGGTNADAARVLDPGTGCVLFISFYPEQAGQRAAEIVIEHSGSHSPLRVPLSGIGIPADSLTPVITTAR